MFFNDLFKTSKIRYTFRVKIVEFQFENAFFVDVGKIELKFRLFVITNIIMCMTRIETVVNLLPNSSDVPISYFVYF